MGAIWAEMKRSWLADAAEGAARYRPVLAAVLFLGALLRFWNVNGASIWMDEAVTLSLAELPVQAIILEKVDNHPPLSFLIQHVWQGVFPSPELARLPAVLFGVGTLFIAMAMMRDLVSARAAVMTGLLLAVCTAHIYYSQEARMYSLVLFGLAMAAWGGVGHVEPGRRSERFYALIYVGGGAIAIYAHLLGLIAMAAIGFASLAGGLFSGGGWRFAREWLVRNLILFALTLPWLVQIPSNMNFVGLHQPTSFSTSLWYFKTMTAYPGLGVADNLLALVLYGLVGISVPLVWLSGRRTLALILAGLVAVYPATLFLISLDRPLIAARTLIPVTLGVCMAGGIGLAAIPGRHLRFGLAGLLGAAGLMSSLHHLAFAIKPENYRQAFAHLDAAGYGNAPVLNCIDMSATAAWYARPEADIYLYQRGGLMHVPGPDYWQAVRMSMSRYGESTAQEIDAFMAGRLLVEGGFEGAFGDVQRVAFMRPFCSAESQRAIETGLAELGFVAASDALMDAGAPRFQIMASPHTHVTLYTRSPVISENGT